MPELPAPGSDPAKNRHGRRQVSVLIKVGMVCFGVGLLAVAVIMVLFATGSTDLPLWLNLVAMLAPVGFGLGLIAVFLESRTARRASALRRSDRLGPASGAGLR